MSFILKTCEIVAGASMIYQFHEFFDGFLKFGPSLIAGPAFLQIPWQSANKTQFPSLIFNIKVKILFKNAKFSHNINTNEFFNNQFW